MKVLLVEDNPTDAFLIQKLLKSSREIPFEVDVSETLSAALEYLSGESAEVILLDLGLPDSKGLSTLEAILAAGSATPIVVLSGMDDEKAAYQAVQQGAQDFLEKGSIDRKGLVRSLLYAAERQRLRTELEEARLREHELAYHDSLTGLPNRRLFYDRLGQAIEHAKRDKTMVGLMFLDLDGFKNINDSLGHGAGDSLLKAVAERLESALRSSDTVGRIGGDEFTVIVENIQWAQDAFHVADTIMRSFEKPFEVEDHEFFVTTGLGVSFYPEDGEDIESLVKRADVAMYRAKAEGKNKYCFYNPSMDAQSLGRLKLQSNLRKAVERDEFVLHFQPQVNLVDGNVFGVEALVRWEDGERGLIPPGDFIPLAEESGLIIPLGDWVMREACRQVKEWEEEGLEINLTVNLSAHQLRFEHLIESVAEAIMDSGLRPERVGLEITESVAMNDVDLSIKMMKHIKDM
jgi:diguanylate cyclase (GGDEF)-like protein